MDTRILTVFWKVIKIVSFELLAPKMRSKLLLIGPKFIENAKKIGQFAEFLGKL